MSIRMDNWVCLELNCLLKLSPENKVMILLKQWLKTPNLKSKLI